jgi:hypothetical protein
MFANDFVRHRHQDGLGHPPAFHYLDLDTDIRREMLESNIKGLISILKEVLRRNGEMSNYI